MAINFPDSPTNGQQTSAGGNTWQYNSTKSVWEKTLTSGKTDLGITVYATVDDLPLSGVSAGAQAFVTGSNRLYISNGTGWYSIGLVNTNPTITSVQDASSNTTPFTLSTDGSATVITVTANDPENVPLTYSYAVTTGSLTNGGGTTATVTQSDNVFTVTPSTTEAYAGTFELTFTASDGINTATSANSFTLQFITTITNSKYTTLLATAVDTSDNNNITDSSSSNHSITVNGDAHAGTFSPYRSGGYSMSFNGTDESFEPNHSSASGLGTTWSVSYWAYIPSSGATNSYPYIFDFDRQNSSGNGFALQANLSFKNFSLTAANVGAIISTAYPLTCFDKWSYYVITHSSGTTTFYIDGSSVGSSTHSGMANVAAQCVQQLVIGGDRYDQSGLYTKMDVRDFHVRSAAHTGTVNNEAAVADSNTVVLAAYKPYLASQTGASTALTPVINNDVSTKPFSPYDYLEYAATDHGGSIYFDGTGDYLKLASNGDFGYATGDFTWELWINFGNVASGNYYILDHGSDGGTISYASNFLRYYNSTVGGSSVLYTTGFGSNFTPNTWYHFAAVRNSGTTSLYTNGLLVSSASDSHNYSAQALSIATYGGTTSGSSSYDFTGFISNLRILKGTAVYTSDFTPPTAPLTAITNTSLLLSGTDASIIDKSQRYNIDLGSTSIVGHLTTKWSGAKSIYINSNSNNSDLITLPAGVLDASKPFTIEMWLRTNSGAVSGFWSIYTDATNLMRLKMRSDDRLEFYHRSGSYEQEIKDETNTYLLNNTDFYHVAVTRDVNSVFYMHQNGIKLGNFTASADYNSSAASFIIGKSQPATERYMNGYIQDFRITQGLARYTAADETSNIPSAPLEG